MNKQEALQKIEELRRYISECDAGYRPNIGETVKIKSEWNYSTSAVGDIAVVRQLHENGASLYNPRWETSTNILYFRYSMIEKMETL